MGEAFAGFVAGYAVALLTTPLVAVWLLQLRLGSALLARLLPEDSSALALGVIVHRALFLFWTALGLLLGLLLWAMGDDGDIAGGANLPFLLFVSALTLAVVAPVAIVLHRARWPVVVAAGIVVVVFGGLMPYLAEWSRFE